MKLGYPIIARPALRHDATSLSLVKRQRKQATRNMTEIMRDAAR
jgi:hypothetical protein